MLATLILLYRFLTNEQFLINLLVSFNSLNVFYTQQRVFNTSASTLGVVRVRSWVWPLEFA